MYNIPQEIDKDENGSIDATELKSHLESCGHEVNSLEIEILMMTADKNNDGRISKEEFIKIVKDDK